MRAKMRCMEVNNHILRTEILLQPVIAKNDDWPGGSKENALFWSASPSGELKLTFARGAEHYFELGEYYYIDMKMLDEASKHEGRPWTLWSVTDQGNQKTFHMGLAYDNKAECVQGSYELSVENEKAWPHFVGHVDSKWQIVFTKSEERNSGCPYTNPEC